MFESLKEEIVYLGAENKNKNETIKVLLENQRYKNNVIPKMINDSFDPENKTQSKSNVSTKPNLSPGNDHDTTVTQNSKPLQSKKNNHKKRNPRLVNMKKHIYFR